MPAIGAIARRARSFPTVGVVRIWVAPQSADERHRADQSGDEMISSWKLFWRSRQDEPGFSPSLGVSADDAGRWVIGAPVLRSIPPKALTAIRVAGFGLVIACILGPLFLSDMVFIAPILVAGTLLAVIGIWTTSGAPIPIRASLSALAVLAFASEGTLLSFHGVRPGEDLRASFFVTGI